MGGWLFTSTSVFINITSAFSHHLCLTRSMASMMSSKTDDDPKALSSRICLSERHSLKLAMREINKLTGKFRPRRRARKYEPQLPFLYNRRAVLHARHQLPVHNLVGLHKLHKGFNKAANDYFPDSLRSGESSFEPSSEFCKAASKRWANQLSQSAEPELEAWLKLQISDEEYALLDPLRCNVKFDKNAQTA